jgi:magnesium chelatase family protein
MVEVAQPTRADLLDAVGGEPSHRVVARVVEARERAAARWATEPWSCNAQAPGAALRGPGWRLGHDALRLVQADFAAGRLSARGVDRVLRLAWTLADLAGRDSPGADAMATALRLRTSSVLPGLVA